MFTDGVAYAAIFSAAITFVVALAYLPAWASALMALAVFFAITWSYGRDAGGVSL